MIHDAILAAPSFFVVSLIRGDVVDRGFGDFVIYHLLRAIHDFFVNLFQLSLPLTILLRSTHKMDLNY